MEFILWGEVMITIDTDRLILRGWNEDDYLDFHEFMSDERVGQCAGTKIITDIEESKNCIRSYIKCNQSYAIVLKSSNKVIGSIGMDDIAPDKDFVHLKQRYIGYTISADYWGNGYATEASQSLIKYLFESINLDLIWSSHYDFNVRSKSVIDKCGFHYKFSRNKTVNALGGRDIKELFYSLTKKE